MSALPAQPEDFISYLAGVNIPVRQALIPYLAHEKELRKSFAAGRAVPNPLENLVPIYAGSEHLVTFKHVDREQSDPDKYIMKLPDDDLEDDGDPAIAESFDDYSRNFDAFTHGVLEDLDWNNVVVAGSSALLPTLPYREEIEEEDPPSGENILQTYYQNIARPSDIDIFLYGLDEEAAIEKIQEIEATVRENQKLEPGNGLTMRSENAITLISPRWPFRHVQIILRIYKSVSEILTGFDVDCACVAFDGKQVYSNPRGIGAIVTRTNQIDLTRRSPSYENRLWKYRHQKFDIYWDSMDRSKIHDDFDGNVDGLPTLKGLARLLVSETRLTRRFYHGDLYRVQRALTRIDNGGEPVLGAASGYAHHDLPTGERFNAERVRHYVVRHSTEPYLFGDISHVILEGAKPSRSKRSSEKLVGKVKFITDDPGRQMIGSFYPLTDDEWTQQAYEGFYGQ